MVPVVPEDANEAPDLLDALAAQAAAGDLAALDALLRAIDDQRLARTAVRRTILADHDVDDVVQDVMVAVAEGIGRFRGEARFTTWMGAIARNKAIAHLRRQRDEASLPDDVVGDAQRVSSVLATRATVDDVIARLPATYRDVVVLRDVHQVPYAEIADRLGLNENTVRTRAARGRALAASLLAEEGL
jgi:RNA polymerase sigma factor (sigma-70 family)